MEYAIAWDNPKFNVCFSYEFRLIGSGRIKHRFSISWKRVLNKIGLLIITNLLIILINTRQELEIEVNRWS